MVQWLTRKIDVNKLPRWYNIQLGEMFVDSDGNVDVRWFDDIYREELSNSNEPEFSGIVISLGTHFPFFKDGVYFSRGEGPSLVNPVYLMRVAASKNPSIRNYTEEEQKQRRDRDNEQRKERRLQKREQKEQQDMIQMKM